MRENCFFLSLETCWGEWHKSHILIVFFWRLGISEALTLLPATSELDKQFCFNLMLDTLLPVNWCQQTYFLYLLFAHISILSSDTYKQLLLEAVEFIDHMKFWNCKLYVVAKSCRQIWQVIMHSLYLLCHGLLNNVSKEKTQM